MKKEFRLKYERELGILEGYGREYAARYPAQAQHLGMANGASDDPHIGRFLQGTAFFTARTDQLLEEHEHKVTEAILSVNYRQYLLPFPSTAIVHVDPGQTIHGMGGVARLPRGTMMTATTDDGIACRFRTVHDVQVAPVAIASVAFHPIFQAPPAVRRPLDAISSISIGIECLAQDPAAIDLPALRTLLAGESSLCATLRDALFLHAKAAWVELPGGQWRALDTIRWRQRAFPPTKPCCPARVPPTPRSGCSPSTSCSPNASTSSISRGRPWHGT